MSVDASRAPVTEYVIQIEHAQEGWRELYRAPDEAEVRRVWERVLETGIEAHARLLEVAVLRTHRPTPARA